VDTFYSGSSDVTLPARGERAEINLPGPRALDDPEVGGPYFCERCDQSVPSHDLAAGRALSIYGLTFCAACRPAVEAERFEIHFCDECGVSIPLAVVEAGEAFLGDGRLACVRCRHRPRRIARRLPLLIAILAGLILVLAAPTLIRTFNGREAPAEINTGPSEAERIDAFQAEMTTRLESIDASIRELRVTLEGLPDQPELEPLRAALDRLDARLQAERDVIQKAVSALESSARGR